MSVYIDQSKGKERLVEEFKKYAIVDTSIQASTNLLIPTIDETLPFFAANRKWFQDKGITVMVASENTIHHCRDKAEFNLFCKRHGFQTPRTWQMNGYLKPRFGKGSRGQTKFSTSYIVQEECLFPEVSVDYFADLKGNPLSMIARYRLNVVNGESQDYAIVTDFNYAEIKRLGMELGLVGHNVIQGYWTGEVFIFGEVNPRFGGGSHFTFDIFSGPRWLVNQHATAMVRNLQEAKETKL